MTQSRNSPPFTESEGSLPFSKHPTIGPYPEPDAPSPQLPPHFPKVHSNIICLYARAVSTLQVFKQKYLMHFSYIPCVLHAPPIPSPYFIKSCLFFYDELLAPRPTLKDHPLSEVHGCMFSYVRSCPSNLEAVSSNHNSRTCPAVVTGTHITWN
jgi:hypothetical protein